MKSLSATLVTSLVLATLCTQAPGQNCQSSGCSACSWCVEVKQDDPQKVKEFYWGGNGGGAFVIGTVSSTGISIRAFALSGGNEQKIRWQSSKDVRTRISIAHVNQCAACLVTEGRCVICEGYVKAALSLAIRDQGLLSDATTQCAFLQQVTEATTGIDAQIDPDVTITTRSDAIVGATIGKYPGVSFSGALVLKDRSFERTFDDLDIGAREANVYTGILRARVNDIAAEADGSFFDAIEAEAEVKESELSLHLQLDCDYCDHGTEELDFHYPPTSRE